MLSLEDLQRLRVVDELAMPDGCVIERPTWTSDGAGGRRRVDAAAGETRCRVRAPKNTPGEQEASRRFGGVMPVVVDLPAGTDVAEKDRLTITPGDWSTPGRVRTLEVVYALPASMATCQTVFCKECV